MARTKPNRFTPYIKVGKPMGIHAASVCIRRMMLHYDDYRSPPKGSTSALTSSEQYAQLYHDVVHSCLRLESWDQGKYIQMLFTDEEIKGIICGIAEQPGMTPEKFDDIWDNLEYEDIRQVVQPRIRRVLTKAGFKVQLQAAKVWASNKIEEDKAVAHAHAVASAKALLKSLGYKIVKPDKPVSCGGR